MFVKFDCGCEALLIRRPGGTRCFGLSDCRWAPEFVKGDGYTRGDCLRFEERPILLNSNPYKRLEDKRADHYIDVLQKAMDAHLKSRQQPTNVPG